MTPPRGRYSGRRFGPLDHGQIGPWPAFVDLFAGMSLVLLALCAVIARLHVQAEQRVGELAAKLAPAEKPVSQADVMLHFTKLRDHLQELAQQTGAFKVVEDRNKNLLLILEADAAFQKDRFGIQNLRDTAKRALGEIARLLMQDSVRKYTARIEIVGHADKRLAPSSQLMGNWQLSAARAATVAQYLTEGDVATADSGEAHRVRLSPCKVTASGRASYYPRYNAGGKIDPRYEALPVRGLLPASDTAYVDSAVLRPHRRIEMLLQPVVVSNSALVSEDTTCHTWRQ